ncbi:MAG: hypothetical protein JWO46_1338, partial [Nocardioidaceae bacterium]|nr:hypothetical protein [Nocardioidaceae bacterium]
MPPLPPPRQSRGTAAGHGSFLTSGTLASRLLGGVLVVLLVSLGLAVAPAPARADGAGCDDAMLTSADQVTLGVSCLGNLGTQPTVADPEGVGLRFLPTEAEAVTQGGVYEGWGVADGDSGVTGNVDPGFAPQNGGQASTNLTLLSFAADAVHAVSHVRVGNTFELTQDVHPSDANPNLFEATVTITNISSATTDLRYRRVMDWDIPPTRFQELVTLQKGSSPYLVYTSDDGFASADPQSERSQRLASGSFVNSGPRDHGALFDFDFGALPAGDSHSFKIFYGAAQNEATAKTALQVAGAEAYSLGEANGSQLDPPVSPADLNTFMFGFKNIAGDANAVFTPFAVKDSASIVTGQQAQINVLANDSDPRGHAISVTGSTAPSHGTATCDTTTCTYVPAADWTGTDTFTYTISNADHLTATADVKVTVSLAAQNHPPVALDDVLTTGEDTDGTVQVLANDSDVDGGEGLAVVVKTQPAHGAVTCQPSGECTYVPSSNYYGDDSFGYTLSDGAGGADDATVVVHVTPVDDDPVGQAISASTDEDTATSITLLATDVDDAPANLSFAAPSESVHGGTITCTTAGACTYQPKPNYAGDDSFTYTISDGHGGSGTQTVSITVNPVNDDPVARDKSFTVAEDSHGEDTVDLLAGATDVDGDTVGLVSHTAAAHGSLDCVVAVCTYV